MNLASKISIVIPTYNRSRMLMRALKAFRAEALPAEHFEIVVADDGSSDGTEACVRSFEADYRIKYCFQEDQGFRPAAARNAGARLADGDILAFFDAGELPSPRFAAGHLSAHACMHSARTAVIGPTFGYSASIGQYHEGIPAAQIYRSIRKETDPRYQAFARAGLDLRRLPLPPQFFWSGNCSVRAESFWEAGGFDESFTEWGMEDVDLAYRLWDRGTAFALCADAWAIELVLPGDRNAHFFSLRRNIAKFLQNCDPVTPAKEILSLLLSVSLDIFFDIQDYYRTLVEWEAQAKHIDVRQEVQSFCRELSPGNSIAILGVGSSIPESWPDAMLYDFDQQFARTLRVPASGVHHRIGLRTGLPDSSVDSLLITSRLQGIWRLFGDSILLEAKRVANDVRLAWELTRRRLRRWPLPAVNNGSRPAGSWMRPAGRP